MSSDIIPAQPGYYQLSVVYEDEGGPRGFSKTPVIAWRILSGDNPYPIGDVRTLAEAIMRPNGSVYIAGERYGDGKEFGNETEALQHFTDDYRSFINNT